jgi:hypothetical protein
LVTATGALTTFSAGTINTTNFAQNQGNYANNGASASLVNLTNSNNAFASGPTFSVVNGSTTDNLYLVGTLTIAAGSATGTETYNLTAFTSGGGYTTTAGPGNGYDLDLTNDTGNDFGGPPGTYTGALSNPTSFTVNVQSASVPEPSSVILTGLVAVGIGIGAWRRRREVGVPVSITA